MTMDEIEAHFDGEWVLIEEPQWTDTDDVVSGRVRLHNPDRAELYRQAMELRPARAAIFFIGTPRDDVAYVL